MCCSSMASFAPPLIEPARPSEVDATDLCAVPHCGPATSLVPSADEGDGLPVLDRRARGPGEARVVGDVDPVLRGGGRQPTQSAGPAAPLVRRREAEAVAPLRRHRRVWRYCATQVKLAAEFTSPLPL